MGNENESHQERTRATFGNSTRDGRSNEVEQLLAHYVTRMTEGELLDPDEIRDNHPEVADALLAALELFVDAGPESDVNVPLGTLGDYTLRRQIGRGGMGVVYEAWEGSMDRRVALKVLPAGAAADDKTFHRFMREARTAGKLNHSNVVPVYGVGIKERTPYYVMELIEGETLAQFLARRRGAAEKGEEQSTVEAEISRLFRDVSTDTDADPEAQLVAPRSRGGAADEGLEHYARLAKAFAGVADGLQHAHSRGVIHRDIKPSNLILDREGRLRILDFGLARLEGQESLTTSGDLLGTVLYMSPEQAMARRIPIDYRTDIYSLGATMYEVLTWKPPFSGKSHQDTLSQIILRDPEPLRRLNPRIPRDLETIVLKCLRKDPADRFGTAEALGQDLWRFVRGDPIEARPQARIEKLLLRLLRLRKRIAAVLLFTALLVAVGVLAAVLFRQHREVQLARYERHLIDGIAGLEAGFQAVPERNSEGEAIALGLVYPGDLEGWLGLKLHLRALHEAAVESLQKAIEAAPWQPEAHIHLARGFVAIGRDAEAAQALSRVLNLAPSFPPALVHNAHRLIGGDPRGREEASRAIELLKASARDDWQRLWFAGHLAALAGDWPEVERIYGALIESCKVSKEPYIGFEIEHFIKRGRVRLRQKDFHGALRDYLAVREKSQSSITPWVLVASAYYFLGVREEGDRSLKEGLARFPGADSFLAAADIYQRFGELERALQAIDSLPETERLAARAKILAASGRWEEAVEAARRALELGARDPIVHLALGEALLNLKDNDAAEAAIDEGLRRFPNDPNLGGMRDIRLAYYRCRHEEMIAALEQEPEDKRNYLTLAWCYYRLNRRDQALEAFNKGVERDPRVAQLWRDRGFCKSRYGDLQGAVPDLVESVVLTNGMHGSDLAWLRELYAPSSKPLFDPLWGRLHDAFASADQLRLESPRQLGFRALACLYKEQPAPDQALELAREAIEKTSNRDSEAFSFLAEVHFARGEGAEAVRAIERAHELRGRWHAIGEQLQLYRAGIFPRLASCVSVEAYLESRSRAGEADPREIEAVRAALAAESPPLLAYLEACLLEREGQLAGAASRLEDLIQKDTLTEQAALLRLARLWARLGRRSNALDLLESRLLASGSETLPAWEAWLSIASLLEPGDLLARPIFAAPPKASTNENPFAGEVRWVLTRLLESGSFRINCGEKDYTDSMGRLWAADRFFDGGRDDSRFSPKLANTADPPLYVAYRAFQQKWLLAPGYRIPLLDGPYKLTLHFAETMRNPFPSRFDIVCEGEMLLEDFDVSAVGFAFAQAKAFQVEVGGGALDLLLLDTWASTIAGIEIERKSQAQASPGEGH